MPILLSNASATGSWVAWDGGTGVFSCVGTFNSATVSLQFQGPDGSTAIDVGTNTTLTAAGAGGFVLPPGRIRASISGSPSAMYAQAEQVR
jgi:hypothetical protein